MPQGRGERKAGKTGGRQARQKEGKTEGRGEEGQLPRGKVQRRWDRWRTRPSREGILQKTSVQ